MIKQVITDADEIDIMGEANDKIPACRTGRNFDERQAFLQNALAKQVNVKIERGNMRVLHRLPLGQQIPNLCKQVIAEPIDHASWSRQLDSDATLPFRKGEDRIFTKECLDRTVDWDVGSIPV